MVGMSGGERPLYREKVRWSYSPDEGPKCTIETLLAKTSASARREGGRKGSDKIATTPVQV